MVANARVYIVGARNAKNPSFTSSRICDFTQALKKCQITDLAVFRRKRRSFAPETLPDCYIHNVSCCPYFH